MKNKFWLCQRGPVFYLLEVETGRRTSLRTTDRTAAEQILRAKNEVAGQPALALALGRAYFSAYNPQLTQRTWQVVVDEYCSRGQPQTQAMRRRKTRHQAFDRIRNQPLLETAAEDFMAVLQSSGVSVAAILRGLHNLAVGLGWLPWPVLAPKLWPPAAFQTQARPHQRRARADSRRRAESGAAALLHLAVGDWRLPDRRRPAHR